MHTGIFDMLRNGILDHLTLLGNGIELDLVGLGHELRDHHRIFLRNLAGHLEEALQFGIVVADVHRSTRKHIRRTNKHRITYLLNELMYVIHRSQRTPLGLVDAKLVEHCTELATVLGAVNRDWRCTQDGHRLTMQFHGEVVGDLSTHRNNHAAWLLQVNHVKYAFERKFVEVEAVAHVVVSRNGLGVVVDHDRLVTQLASSIDGIYRTPVELYRRADAVSTRTEHYHRLLVRIVVHVVTLHGVGHIQVVGEVGMFRSHSWDALHGRKDIEFLAQCTYGKHLLLHVAALMSIEHEAGNLEVREAQHLGLGQHFDRKLVERSITFEHVLVIDDVLHPFDEPWVDLREFVQSLDAVAFLQSLGDGEDTQVGWVRKFLVEVVEACVVVAHKAVHTLSDHTQTLLQHFLERTSDGHDFAHRLHRRTDLAAYTHKLREVPAWDLADHIVERRSHIGRVGCAHLANLVERIAQGNLCGNESQRITRSLRSKGGRTRQTSIDLDDTVVVGLGIEGKLDVALTYNVQMTHALDGQFLQHLHLLVGQRTGWSHHNRLACMDAEWVEVLHRSHGEAVVVGVANALELDLLPALQRLLYQNLGREGEGTLSNLLERSLVGTDARTQATQGIGRTDHDWITDLAGRSQGIFKVLAGMAHGHLGVNLVQFLHEKVAVFGVHDGLHAGAKYFHAVLLQHTLQVEFGAAVERGLSTECKQDAVGTLLLDDLGHIVGVDRKEINLVSNTF